MGEAKWRQANDPTFGKTPKSTKSRGLIVSAPMTVDLHNNLLHLESSALNSQELRFGLLFWDLLAWPLSRAIAIEGGDDEKYLEECGVLIRPKDPTPPNGPLASAFVNSQLWALTELDRKEPGCWALAQGDNALSVVGGLDGDHGGLDVSLRRAIPIPHHDVPLAEILEFKERRKDEFLSLRALLDQMIGEIQVAPNNSSEILQARLKDIDGACADLLHLGKDWQFPMYLADFQASINLNVVKAGGAAYGAYKGTVELGLNQSTSVVAGVAVGLASVLDIKGRPQLRNWRRAKSPFRYAYHLNTELK